MKEKPRTPKHRSWRSERNRQQLLISCHLTSILACADLALSEPRWGIVNRTQVHSMTKAARFGKA